MALRSQEMSMTKTQANSTDPTGTVASALLILFFIQLLTVWIESIYRLSLIKLGPGTELAGLLFMLLPLLLLFVGGGAQRYVCGVSVFVVLLARALCPFFGAPELIVVAGTGVGTFLIVLCFMLSGTYRFPMGKVGVGTGVAVLLSGALRAWGSSFDLSMGWRGAVLAWGLVALAALLLRGDRAEPDDDESSLPAGFLPRLAALIVLFSSFAITYVVLSSPAVVTAWSGSNYLVGTVLLVASFACVLGWYTAGMPGPIALSRAALVVWNLAFIACLLLGIKLHMTAFPAYPDSPAVFVTPTSWIYHVPFYAMFVLSPVVIVNILVAGTRPADGGPRAQVLPVLAGMLLLLVITLLLTFTNIWGYIGPISHPLRNKFYLPLLIAGIGLCVPLLLPVWGGAFPLRKCKRGSTAPVIGATIIAVLAIAGVAVHSARTSEFSENIKTLTVLTYNMQQGSEKEGDRNLYDQLAFIRKVNPDLIGLQESDGTRTSGANIDAVRFFADALGFHVYYGPNTISGTFGTAILSRFPLENPRTFFTYSTIDEVGTAVAEIEVGGRRIAVFNSHPAGPPHVMLAHARALVEECAKYDHVIAVGDYNSRPSSDAYAVVAEVLSDSWAKLYPDGVGAAHPEWPGDGPEENTLDMAGRIDHIFVSDDFNVEETYNVPAPDSETDHPAHWSILSWE